jgi:hypothetical protein
LTLATVTLAILAGCSAKPAYQGQDRGVLAVYRFRTLSATLPGEIRVPAIVAASEAALRQRGYTVTHSSMSEDSARIDAEAHDAGLLESVCVKARVRPGEETSLDIRFEPLGDQTKSRALLDTILAQLGR